MNASKRPVLSRETLDRWVAGERLDPVRRRLPQGMRQRRLGVERFLWLGLFAAAHALLPNLEAILGPAAAFLFRGVKESLATVSAFCQYRARFPPQGLGELLASARGAGP
ncbi:MAG: hypothetical protein V2A77_04670 [Pseudomonadota bacterium]